MNIDKLESLKLPLEDYARVMAEALAMIYWHAKLDANDVEFILAPKGCHETNSGFWKSDVLGEHTLWLLDSDCVKPMSMDAEGISQAALAFFRNDPYFPRPCRDDRRDVELWDSFVRHSLRSSEAIIGESPLPKMLVAKLEEIGMERRQRRAENERSVRISSIY